MRTGFDAGFRAVTLPHMGTMHVKPEDTKGSYSDCWCGLPEGHNWPGKTDGRHHPTQYTREELMAHAEAATENVPHITRADLRGFGDNYTEIIIKAVNDYGTRYRLNNRGIMLYPPDGTEPYSLAMRENHRTLKAVRIWFAKHIADLDAETKKAVAKPLPQTDADIEKAARRLAERHNSPEHPVPVPVKAPAKRAAKKAAPSTKENAVAAATVEPTEATTDVAPWLQKFSFPTRPVTAGWHICTTKMGLVNPFAEMETLGQTVDTHVACLIINDDGPCTWTGTSVKAAAGHLLAIHDPEHHEALYGKEASKKKSVTMRSNANHAAIETALKMISKATGVTLSSGPSTEVKDLQKQIADLQRKVSALTAERDDAVTRLGLMQEAFRGL
jgi:hypothetical protein